MTICVSWQEELHEAEGRRWIGLRQVAMARPLPTTLEEHGHAVPRLRSALKCFEFLSFL